jgi:uncharacterized membrane protein HdeD (DUF308 family)
MSIVHTRPQKDQAQKDPAQGYQPGRVVRVLRTLYLFRVVFAVGWVALVSATASDGRVTLLIGTLLILYPASDAIASIFEIRADRWVAPAWHYLNMAAGGAAALAVAGTVFFRVSTAISIFGLWAIVSGITQTAVAIVRRPRMGGQWPLIISGVGSVAGGLEYVGWSGTADAGLNALAVYAEGGAFFYLLTVGWWFLLMLARGRRSGVAG